jgi:hypothetical protein
MQQHQVWSHFFGDTLTCNNIKFGVISLVTKEMTPNLMLLHVNVSPEK